MIELPDVYFVMLDDPRKPVVQDEYHLVRNGTLPISMSFTLDGYECIGYICGVPIYRYIWDERRQ